MINVGVRSGTAVGIVLLACAGAPVLAALPNPLADGLRQCASESDQAKRLACFDALAAKLPKVEADQFGLTADIARKRQPPPTASTAKNGAATTGAATNGGATNSASKAATAGREGAAGTGGATANTNTTGAAASAAAGGTAAAARTAATAANKAEPKPAEQVLPGKITALRQASNGGLVFTLDNNQVWVQADPDSRFIFKVGDDVHIEHGAMGSFWLAANKGRKTKVKRIS